MQIELSARAQQVIEERVADGDFANAAEAIEQAVSLLEEQHTAYIAYLREAVAEGLASADRGEVRELGPEFFESIRERIRLRASARAHADGQ